MVSGDDHVETHALVGGQRRERTLGARVQRFELKARRFVGEPQECRPDLVCEFFHQLARRAAEHELQHRHAALERGANIAQCCITQAVLRKTFLKPLLCLEYARSQLLEARLRLRRKLLGILAIQLRIQRDRHVCDGF
jgi:hypothetical protein